MLTSRCVHCKKQFKVYPYRKGKAKYCGFKCYGKAKQGHIPWNKGVPWSNEIKKKLSIAHKGLKPWNWKPKKLFACEYCNVPFYPRCSGGVNRFCSKECANASRRGKPNWAKGKRFPERCGINHHNWKGDKVSYSGLHKWVASTMGCPKKCDICGTTKATRFEWANKSGKYKRDIKDWLRLCSTCHKKYDKENKIPTLSF